MAAAAPAEGIPGDLAAFPFFIAHPWLAWMEESHPPRKLKRLLHLFDLTLRYLGASIGAEIIREGQLAHVVDWFKRPITPEAVHQINLTALRRARPALTSGMFTLLQPIYLHEDALACCSDILAARQNFGTPGGQAGSAAGLLHDALAPRMDSLLRRFAPAARFKPVIVRETHPRDAGGFDVRGLAACGTDPVFAPIFLETDREPAAGTVCLWDTGSGLSSLDPWILHETCPLCREQHLFLLKDILDSAAQYISVEGACLAAFPLDGQALLSRAVQGDGPGIEPSGTTKSVTSLEPAAPPVCARQPEVLGMRMTRTFRRREQGIRSMAWSPDGRWLATGGADGAARVDEYESGEPMALLKHHSRPVTGLAWSPDQRNLATAGMDGALVVWETARWKPIDVKEGSWFYPATALAWSPSGVLLASAHEESKVWIWESGTWKMQAMLEGHGEGASCLAWFGPRHLLTGAADGRVRMWDVYAKKLLWIGYGHEQGVTALEPSPDGRWLVSAGGDGTLLVWNAEEGLPLKKLETGGAAIESLSACRQGRHLASRSADGILRIWDTGRWETVAVMREPQSLKRALIQFHPFVGLLATADPRDQRVRVLRLDPAPPKEPSPWGASGLSSALGRDP